MSFTSSFLTLNRLASEWESIVLLLWHPHPTRNPPLWILPANPGAISARSFTGLVINLQPPVISNWWARFTAMICPSAALPRNIWQRSVTLAAILPASPVRAVRKMSAISTRLRLSEKKILSMLNLQVCKRKSSKRPKPLWTKSCAQESHAVLPMNFSPRLAAKSSPVWQFKLNREPALSPTVTVWVTQLRPLIKTSRKKLTLCISIWNVLKNCLFKRCEQWILPSYLSSTASWWSSCTLTKMAILELRKPSIRCRRRTHPSRHSSLILGRSTPPLTPECLPLLQTPTRLRLKSAKITMIIMRAFQARQN